MKTILLQMQQFEKASSVEINQALVELDSFFSTASTETPDENI
jgi:hypothetical protein